MYLDLSRRLEGFEAYHPGLPGVIASLRQTEDFTPGYIAERACRAARPTWSIASHRQTADFTPGLEKTCWTSLA
jgi:hypothetical protein